MGGKEGREDGNIGGCFHVLLFSPYHVVFLPHGIDLQWKVWFQTSGLLFYYSLVDSVNQNQSKSHT